MKLFEIIKSLKDTASTNAKQAILEAHKDNETLKTLFFATLNPMTNFYLRGDKIHTNSLAFGAGIAERYLTKADIDLILDTLHNRKLTGHAARDFVQNIVDELFDSDKELVIKMLNRDLDCKVSVGLVDRVWKGLIKEYPCLLASKMDAKAAARISTWESFFLQLKADGGRANARVEPDGAVTFFSRAGNVLNLHGVMDKWFAGFGGYVVDGELLYRAKEGVENRQTGNGIFNKAVRGTLTKVEAEGFVFVVWDIIPIAAFDAGYDPTGYKQRFERLTKFVEAAGKDAPFELIESMEATDMTQVEIYFRKKLAQKEEGAMVKKSDMPWENTRSEFMVKLKEIKRAELRCVGTEPHRKDPNKIGSLLLATDDGKLVTGSGSGLTDEDRNQPESYFLDAIFEIEYNSVIKAKGDKKPSLFLPVIVQKRLDKSTTDKFEDM